MNYFGKFDAKVSDALGQHPGNHLFSETVHAHHVPSDAIIVSDAQLLFNAEFKRTGLDLVLSGDGREVVLHDYFKGEKHAPLASPDGAHLTGDLVNALAGQVQYAQADGSTSANKVIGHVTKLVGSATATRNGVSIILNNGDNVEKGDVVQSGSDSTVGITFIDGTVFGLSSNARMVLNEMVYDPNGSNNSSLLSLVAGTITFVAGETAKHGDMKVDTPVATMGIRGTAVLVEIDFSVPGTATTPDARFQVLVEPDGTTGSYILFDKTTLTPLAVVDKAGTQINISNGVMSQTLAPLSPEVQKLITDVFSLKFSDSNTKSIQNFTDSIVPNGIGSTQFATIIGPPTIPVIIQTVQTGNGPNDQPPSPDGHIPIAPSVAASSSTLVRLGATTDTVSGTIKFADINAFDLPSASAKFVSLTLTNSKGQDITASLTPSQLAALEIALTIVQDPAHKNTGTATYTYSVPDSVLSFLATGDRLTLTYNAIVDNNFAPYDQTGSQQFTITILGSNQGAEIWSETTTSNSAHPGDWNGPENWQSGKVPTANDVVIIGSSEPQTTTPFYPVTIKSTADGGTAAFAYSVTMAGSGEARAELDNYNTLTIGSGGLTLNADSTLKNFGTVSAIGVTLNDSAETPPELDNHGTLTIGSSGLSLNADSILKNFSTISVGGLAEILQASVLQNSGTLTLNDGGDFLDQSSITNSGTITLANGILNVAVDIANSGGTLTVGDGTILTVDGATISGGALSNSGTIISTGISALDNVAITNNGTLESASGVLTIDPAVGPVLINSGTLEANGGELDITNEPVTNTGTLQAIDNSTLKLTSTTVTNTSGTVTIAKGSTLDLVNAAIDNGALGNSGTVNSTGASALDNVAINNSGTLESTSGVLTIDPGVPGPTLLNSGTLEANGGELDITNEPVTNTGTLQAIDNSTLKLTSTTVTNTGGTVAVGSGSTLDLASATINGGAVKDAGALVVTASSEIENATVNGGGDLTVSGGTLTFDAVTLDNVTLAGSFSNASTLTIDNTVTLNGATIGGGTIDDTGTLLVTASSEIDNATIDGGNLTVTGGTLTLDAVTLDNVTVSGNVSNSSTVTVDGTVTLDGGTISGGLIDNTGTLLVTASSEIDNAIVDGGNVTVTGGTLTFDAVTLDNVTLAGSFSNSSSLVVEDMVTLNGATIDGGTIDDFGTLSVTASSEISNATVDGGGDITVGSGKTLTFDAVTLDEVTLSGSFANSSSLVVEDTVTLNGATIDGGTIDDFGTLLVTASSEISNATVDSGGNLTVTGGTLTFDTVTLDSVTLAGSFSDVGTVTIDNTVTLNGATLNGGTIKDTGTLSVTASSEIENATVNGGGNITVGSGKTLTLATVTLDSVTLAGSFSDVGTLTIDNTVTLNGATLNGGTIKDTGTLSVIASSEIENATVDGGGNITVGSGKTLTLAAVTLDSVTLAGSFSDVGTVTIDNTVTLNGATLNGGTIKDTGTLSVTASSEIENATVNGGGNITVGSGKTLTLDTVTLDSVTLAGSFSDVGTLTIDNTVTLNGATLNGGTIADFGTLAVTASSEIENATVNGGGNITVGSGKTLTLDTVTLDSVTLAGNFSDVGTLTIDNTVTLNGATLSGGTIKDTGTLSVTASSEIESATVNGGGNITVGSGKTLTLDNVTLDSVTLAGSFSDVGTLTIDNTVTLNGATLNGGTIADFGTLAVTTSSEIENATVNGGGNITVGSGKTLTLDNVALDSVTLAGSISDVGTLTIDNTVTLNGATLSGGTIDDFGTLSVTASSEIENATINSGGNISVGSGKTLTLDDVTLIGVMLSGVSTSSTVTIDDTVTLAGSTITGGTLDVVDTLDSTGISLISGTTIVNSGDIDVLNGTLTIDPSSLTNTGIIEVFSNAGLMLSDELVTNTGGAILVDPNATLTLNGTTISGGTLNNFVGTVDVRGNSSISANITNTGTVQANGAALTLVGNTVANTGGIIKSIGAGGGVKLVGATINGGGLGGNIATATGNVVSTLDSVTLSLGALAAAAVGVLELKNIITNYGEIDATKGTLDLYNATINGGTLGGTGTITTLLGNSESILNNLTIALGTKVSASSGELELTGTINNNGEIDATTGFVVLDRATVIGGTLGGSGTIAADNTWNALDNVTIASGTTVSASSGAHLSLAGTITNHGEIDAASGSFLGLYQATIIGGTLGGSGTIATYTGSFDEFVGVTIASGTTVGITDNSTLELMGVTESGTIALNGVGDITELEISGSVTLTGGGNVTMSDSAYNFIVSNGSAATLTNADTISGAGTIGDSFLTLVNNGTIDATGLNPLIIATGANSVTNNGLLEASAGSTLKIEANITGSSGQIEIFNNATVEITGSVSTSETVTFGAPHGSVALSGLLILDDSHDFNGKIVGLVENSNESLENHVDLRDLAYVQGHMTAHFDDGVVRISNGSDTVYLHINGTGDDESGSFEFASDGVLMTNGSRLYGTLIDDPPAAGSVTIGTDQTLVITAASSATVTFTNATGNTGELMLTDSKDFTGKIVGFTGDGTLAKSDLIDVGDVQFANIAMDKTTYTTNPDGTGTLTLYNANGVVLDSLKFVGNYQLANFIIENDGSGNTLIVDPPANTSSQPQAGSIVASAPNQTLSGSAPSDNFIFNFAGVGQSTVANFHPATDTLQFGNSIFANAQAALSAVHDDGHGNAIVAIDAHDSITLAGVLKSQLHVSDFHIV